MTWYKQHARSLPWRCHEGEKAPDPYAVWVSEVMLQQTTVATVQPYFQRFMQLWPTVYALSEASLDEVLHAWQGLGYYQRARLLWEGARYVVSQGGSLPQEEKELLSIPGIGPYTAGAIAAIAFQRPVLAVDGNLMRVGARYWELDDLKDALYHKVKEKMQSWVERVSRPGDIVQALMDIGATICRPRRPLCGHCPLREGCKAYAHGSVDKFPVASEKKKLSVRYGRVFWICRDDYVLIQKRPSAGILGGLMQLPTTEWAHSPVPASAIRGGSIVGAVQHTFTHFKLGLVVEKIVDASEGEIHQWPESKWVAAQDLHQYAFPTLMHKVIRLVNKTIR